MENGLLKDLAKYTIHTTSYLLYRFLYAILSFLNGIYGTVNRNINVSGRKSALLKRVIWRKKWSTVYPTSQRDFLTVFVRNVDPEFVIQPNVSLYCITNEEAMFVETPTETDLYRSEISPFLYDAQFQYCQRCITMPMAAFHKLAEKLGSLNTPVIWLSNTARCGSTIIGQMFGSVAGTLLVSENDALTNLALLRIDGVVSDDGYLNLLSSVIKIICKPHPGVKRFCIKPRNCAMVHMEAISRLFPNIQQWFVYRNCLETLSSLLEFSTSDRAKMWSCLCLNNDFIPWLIPLFRQSVYHYFAVRKADLTEDPAHMNTVEFFTSMWACFINRAMRFKETARSNLHFIKYEDLISDPGETCKCMFDIAGIKDSMVEVGLRALKKDSQKGTALGNRSKGKNPWRHITPENKQKANAILMKSNLPLLGNNMRI